MSAEQHNKDGASQVVPVSGEETRFASAVHLATPMATQSEDLVVDQEIQDAESTVGSAGTVGQPVLGEEVPLPTLEPLTLTDVVLSTRVTFPAIRQAVAARDQASGEIIASLGKFDDVLEGYSINQPLGYYENYRQGISIKRPLVSGGYLYGGYRIGDGYFEPYYNGRETDEGGEFKLGFDIPLLQGRAIDKRRADLWLARLRRQQADPMLRREILDAQASAVDAYWQWVAAGRSVEVRQTLVDLGQTRGAQIEEQLAVGNAARFTLIDNQRLIAGRRIKLIDAERKFGEAAVKLSLYLRDLNGQPVLPDPRALPPSFPKVEISDVDVETLIGRAIAGRPEVEIPRYDAQMLRVELNQALNQMLPELNLTLETSQDVGGKTSSSKKGEKAENIIEAGVYGSVPIQRRYARGKADSIRAKLVQVEAKLQLTENKIATQVQQILVNREAALLKARQAEENLRLAEEALGLFQEALREGAGTIPILNIYEESVAESQQEVINATAEYWTQDALLALALGQDVM